MFVLEKNRTYQRRRQQETGIYNKKTQTHCCYELASARGFSRTQIKRSLYIIPYHKLYLFKVSSKSVHPQKLSL